MHRTLPFRPWQQARSTAAAARPRSVGQVFRSVRMSTVPARQRSDREDMSARAGGGSTLIHRRRTAAASSHRGSLVSLTSRCMTDSLEESASKRPRRAGARPGFPARRTPALATSPFGPRGSARTPGRHDGWMRRRCRSRNTSPQAASIGPSFLGISTMTRSLRVQPACRGSPVTSPRPAWGERLLGVGSPKTSL